MRHYIKLFAMGVLGVAAGSPVVPGLIASFRLNDSLHQPKIAAFAAAHTVPSLPAEGVPALADKGEVTE